MSSFSKVGKREKTRNDKRLSKKHLKQMYVIMDELEIVAKEMHQAKEDWNEDNIAELAANYTELNIADMEKFMLLGKLSNLKVMDEAKDNSK